MRAVTKCSAISVWLILSPNCSTGVDEGVIALSLAVELSYLSEEQQKALLDTTSLNDCAPSYAQRSV